MKKKRILLSLVLCLLLTLLPVGAGAAETAQSSDNRNAHDYSVWSSPVGSYLVENASGYLRVEYAENRVYEGKWVTKTMLFAEQYDGNMKFVSRTDLTMELDIFGGFYSDGRYYYLVFGQKNTGESNSVEVLRVVKYDTNWNRQGSVSVKGANTTVPFDAGSLRMVHTGNFLFIHTCHEMYTNANDGLNHQANMTYSINTSTMKLMEQKYTVSNVSHGYVSHSFNQYIALDGNKLLTLDHGDYYPRSAVLVKYSKNTSSSPLGGTASYVNVLSYQPNSSNYNVTGASVGGLAVSSTAYLTVGSSIPQNGSTGASAQRNIYITATSKTNFTSSGTTLTWLTNYSSGVSVSNPYLVQVSTTKFAVIWTEGETLKWVFVDGNGKKTTSVYSAAGALSDCQPIVADNKILWYVTDESVPRFYWIDLSSAGTLNEFHEHSYENLVTAPTEEAEGILNRYCSICGVYADPVAMPVLSGDAYDFEYYIKPTCTGTGQGHYIWKDLTYGKVDFYVNLPAAGHTYGEVTVLKEPASYQEGRIRGICSVCGSSYTAYIPKLNEEDYTLQASQPATCTENGSGTYVWNSETFGTHSFTAVIYAKGHDLVLTETEATCTENGTWTYNCSNCDYSESYISQWAKGHDWTDWTVGEDGARSRTCLNCGETEVKSETASPENPFVDLVEGKYYYEPVLWAYSRGITTGTDATHFSPNRDCNRQQMVMFLWRYAGEPVVEGVENPFTDVSESSRFYNAIMWAVSEGITTGKTDTTFEPTSNCTRQQMVMFLYRMAGSPDVSGVQNPFADVGEGNRFYNAILWAYSTGVTKGVTETTFVGTDTCTRGQFVTFLYRMVNG